VLRQFKLTNDILEYELIYSRRKTIGIMVYPDARVVVRAPAKTPIDRIEAVLSERAAWIQKHRRRFTASPRAAVTPHRYVSGEVFRYLGGEYTLHIEKAERERVVLTDGALIVRTPTPDDPRQIEKLVVNWYTRQARRVFEERLNACFEHIRTWNVAYPQLGLRRMKSRWGSCSSRGKVTLNIRLVQAPVDLIDYVIYHELCHLREMNHSKAFYALQSSLVPNWRDQKRRLNEYPFTV
jgi:predicted metal-dependent hydrolase